MTNQNLLICHFFPEDKHLVILAPVFLHLFRNGWAVLVLIPEFDDMEAAEEEELHLIVSWIPKNVYLHVSLQLFFQAPATHFMPVVFNLSFVENLITAL